MCILCKGEMKPSRTIFSIQFGNNVVVIKNVPCMECEQCGHTEIDDATMQCLEKIVDTAKKLMQEVAVIDYSMAA